MENTYLLKQYLKNRKLRKNIKTLLQVFPAVGVYQRVHAYACVWGQRIGQQRKQQVTKVTRLVPELPGLGDAVTPGPRPRVRPHIKSTGTTRRSGAGQTHGRVPLSRTTPATLKSALSRARPTTRHI